MILIFVELAESTAETQYLGKDAAAKELFYKFNEVIEEFRVGNSKAITNPTLKQLGPPSRNSILLVDEDNARIKEHIESAMRIQNRYRGMVVGPKIAIGVGDPVWRGQPYDAKSTIIGTVVNLTLELLEVCPPSGIVITEGAHALVIEYPEISRQLEYGSTYINGLSDTQPYWYIDMSYRGGGSQVVRPDYNQQQTSGSEILILKDQVKELAESVNTLSLNAGKLNITVRILCWVCGWLALSTMLTWFTLIAVVFWLGKAN